PPTDPWPPVSTNDYGLNPTTQQAARGPPDLRQPNLVPTPISVADAAHAGPRQRVFTIQDPPSRRDLAEAFQHVQQAARQTGLVGRREIIELQLLEHFVEVWDCRCVGLSTYAKLRIFDRARLLYHVALVGWGPALEGYADPSATYLLGPPPPRRQTPKPPVSRDASPPPAANTRAAKRQSPKKKKK
ncbi:unnamed protein product, partial [Ixodes hexagonus]